MIDLTATQLAETYAKGAKSNYERDGHLVPMVHILDAKGAGASLIPNPDRFGGQAREQLSSLVLMMNDVIRIRFVVSTVEAWIKAFPDAKEEPQLERGQLQKESDTDPSIRTALVIMALDIEHPPDSHWVNLILGTDDPRKIEWEETVQHGMPDGAMADLLVHAAHVQKGYMPNMGLNAIARIEFLGQIEFIHGGALTIAEETQN